MAAFIYNMTDTWNNAGTAFAAIKMNVTNTASASGSTFMDVQSGGSSIFQIMKETSRGGTGIKITAETPNSQIVEITPRDAGTGLAIYSSGGAPQIFNGLIGAIGITCFATLFGNEAKLFCDGANTLAQRNDTNAQTFRVYNTYTDAANFERGIFDWTTTPDLLTIGYQKAGTGSNRAVKLQARNNGDTNITLGINNTIFDDINGQWLFRDSGSGSYVFEIRSKGAGYGTAGVGMGGIVTQLTNKATGVTLSKPTGQITMHNASLAADTTVSFTLTNTNIEATDMLILNHISGGTAGAYTLNAQCASGTASINVRNVTAGSLGEAIVIQFAIFKGVIN